MFKLYIVFCNFIALTLQCEPPVDRVITTSAPVTDIGYGSVIPNTSTNGSCGHSIYWNSGELTHQYIVGGVEAANHEFPWQVYLLLRENQTNGAACGGAMIAPKFVLTAAHCCTTASTASDITIYYGARSLTGTADGAFVKLKPSKIILHTNYSATTLDYDFCILEVPSSSVLRNAGWAIQPICLPSSCSDTCQDGEIAIISGWGVTSDGGLTSDTLLKAAVPIVSTASCSTSYSGSQTITDRKVCAGYTGSGGVAPCNGDSGGPLACYKNGYFTLDGVVSNSIGCGLAAYPSVFSRVCSVLTWIHSIIDGT